MNGDGSYAPSSIRIFGYILSCTDLFAYALASCAFIPINISLDAEAFVEEMDQNEDGAVSWEEYSARLVAQVRYVSVVIHKFVSVRRHTRGIDFAFF